MHRAWSPHAPALGPPPCPGWLTAARSRPRIPPRPRTPAAPKALAPARRGLIPRQRRPRAWGRRRGRWAAAGGVERGPAAGPEPDVQIETRPPGRRNPQQPATRRAEAGPQRRPARRLRPGRFPHVPMRGIAPSQYCPSRTLLPKAAGSRRSAPPGKIVPVTACHEVAQHSSSQGGGHVPERRARAPARDAAEPESPASPSTRSPPPGARARSSAHMAGHAPVQCVTAAGHMPIRRLSAGHAPVP